MQADPRYDDVAAEVAAFLEERLAFAVAAGIPEERVCLDPGIGFGKTPAQNFELVRRLDVLLALGRPGARRALAQELAREALRRRRRARARSPASLGAAVAAYERGASIFRVHDVREHVEALTAAGASRVMRSSCTGSSCTAATACSTGARARPALPLRRRAGGGRAGSSDRHRGRRRLPRRRRLRARGLRRPRVPPARGARRRGRGRAARALPGRARLGRVSASRSRARPAGRVRGRHRRRGRDASPTSALGSNLGDREATIRAAVAALPGVVAVSALRETDPVGVTEQPAFLNGAVALETELSPRELLDACWRSSGSSAASAASAGGRARSTSTCFSTATETVDEPGPDASRTRACTSAASRSSRSPSSTPSSSVPGRGRVKDLLAELD